MIRLEFDRNLIRISSRFDWNPIAIRLEFDRNPIRIQPRSGWNPIVIRSECQIVVGFRPDHDWNVGSWPESDDGSTMLMVMRAILCIPIYCAIAHELSNVRNAAYQTYIFIYIQR